MTVVTRDDAVSGAGSILFSIRVACVLALTLPGIWAILILTPSGAPMHRRVRRFARLLIDLSGYTLRVHGLEHLAAEPCAVIVANHASYLDSVVLAAAIPRNCRMVVNHLAATQPLVGLIVRRCQHIVVDRRSAESRANCSRTMIATLHQGTSLLIFPEGTRAVAGMLPFQGGAFLAAMKAGRKIVPIAVGGTRDIWPRGLRLWRRGAIDVHVLPAIALGAQASDETREAQDAAAAAIAAALSQ